MIYYFINNNKKFNYFTKINVFLNDNIIYSTIIELSKNIFYFTELNKSFENNDIPIVIIESLINGEKIKFELNDRYNNIKSGFIKKYKFI